MIDCIYGISEQARSDQVHVFLVESCLMKGLPHPNIHPVIGACIDDKLPPYILYPYSTEGNLKKFLHKCRISDCNSHYVSGCLICLFSSVPPG